MKETLGAARSKQGDRRVDSEGELSTTEEIRLLKDENAKLKEELKELKRSVDGTKSDGLTRKAEAGPSKQTTSTKNDTSVVNSSISSNVSNTTVLSNGDSHLSNPSPHREFKPELPGPPLHWNPQTRSLEPVASTSQSQQRQPSPPPLARVASILRQPSPLPTPPRRSPPLNPSPPGPFFSIIHHNSPQMIPDDLRSRLYVVLIRDLPFGVTPLLLLHFLRRPQKQRVPRPVALAVTNAGNVMMAFTSEASAQTASQCLDGKGLPGFIGQRKMQAESKPRDQHRFRWCQLSDEMRDSWSSGRQMPRGEWVSVSAPPSRGSVVSDEYEQERRCVLDWQRQRAEQDQRQREEFEEEQRRYQQQIYEEQMRNEEQIRFEEEEQRRQSFSYQEPWASFDSGEEDRDSDSDSDDCEREWKRQRFY